MLIIASVRPMVVGEILETHLKDAATGERHPARYRVLREATEDEWRNAPDRPERDLPPNYEFFYAIHTD